MATRFYLANSTAVLPTLAISSEWDGSTGNKSGMGTTRTGSALTDTQSAGETSATAPFDFGAYQYVSTETIPDARTIGGTVSAVIRGYQNTGALSFLQLVIRVVSNDGSVVRGTLYAGATQTAVTATAGAQNQETPTYAGATGTPTRIWNAVTLTPVAAQAGDRVVVEVGARFTNTSTTLATYRFYRGDPTDTTTYPDLPLSAGATTQGVPWVEFSDNLFGAAGGGSTDGVLTANLPKLTTSFAAGYVAPPVDATLDGNLPALIGAFTGDLPGAPLDATLAGSLPSLTGTFEAMFADQIGTDTSNTAALVRITGLGYVDSNPPIDPTPAALRRGHDYIKAMAYTAPTLVDGRPVDYAPEFAETKAHRDRIIVGGKDVTYFRGVQTPLPGFLLVEPFAYGATTLTFPQTHAAFERPGHGELKWLAKEKRVRFQRIDVDTKTGAGVDYYGVITAVRAEGRNWVADVGGDLTGRASMRDQQPPLFRWVRDIARHAHDSIRALNLRTGGDWDDIGIDLAKQGGMSHLDWLNHLVRMAVKKDGTAYTILPRLDNENVWELRPKDTTTRHATAYFDDAHVVADLVDDLAEQPNMIFGTGVTPGGMKVKNGRYPGLIQAEAPAYPFVGDVGVGEVSGSDVAVMNWRLIGAKYLDERDTVSEFTADTADSIEDLQEDAGLPVTGRMDAATWDALFDLTVTGYSLRQSAIEPMAQATDVRKWNRTGSGARATRNAGYDPSVLQVHRTVDFGSGHKKQQMVRWARRERLRVRGKNWVGTIRVNIRGLIRGDHTPGTPLTPADVMPVRELRPGMNVWAPLFDGGTLFHIAGIQVDEGGRTATLTVDTKARDMLEAWEITQRNRESRRDPARSFFNQFRKRGQIDSLITFDEVGGLVFDKITCPANQWTVFPVVAGQEGTVRQIRVQTSDAPAAYSLSVWGKEVDGAVLDAAIPAPLNIDSDGETAWSKGLDLFNEKILLGSWGDEEQPCGYAPGKHTNDKGETTSHPVTGLFVDEGGFSYHTDEHPVLYVAIWPKSATTIEPQRIMWPQLEEGQ